MQLGSGAARVWLWLWCRPKATTPIGPLAWETPYAVGVAMKRKKKKKKKERKKIFWIKKKKKDKRLSLFSLPQP